ncbi:MAG: CocE/NonD family hydrolase [Clostridia bacterium]|nr:CocE/NonD family hydrolase [Clostridia bacterium]
MRIQRDVMVPMRDGVRLATNIYSPDAEGCYPAIAIRTPYTKSSWEKQHLEGDQYMNPQKFTDAGYVVVVNDCRGTGNSEGSYVPWRDDAWDGYDFIEWVAAQEWCTGKIGAMGSSNLGSVQLLEASMCPPHLTTICPCGTSAHMPFFRHGIMNLAGASTWYLQQADRAMVNPNIPEDKRENLRAVAAEAKADMNRQYEWLPLKDMPLAHMKDCGVEPYFNEWLEHVADTAYWKKMYMPANIQNINIPILFITHWYDHLAKDTLDAYHEIVHYGTEEAQKNVHLYIGPWRKYAGIEGGENDNWNDGRRLSDVLISWFDHWLYGKENEIATLPSVLYHTMGDVAWKYADSFPLPETKFTRYYFSAEQGANSVNGDGVLSTEAPKAGAKADEYDYDPMDPTPCRSGIVISPGDSLRQSQEDVEKRSDVLVYSSDVLTEDLKLVGPVEVDLWAASSAVDTDFTAKLVDVREDGSTYNVIEGIVRARLRDGLDKEQLLVPGAVYQYRIPMSATGIIFKKGHKLRVEISSSNFPKHDRNMNTGNPVGEDAVGIVAHQTVYHDAAHPSCIVLPVIAD